MLNGTIGTLNLQLYLSNPSLSLEARNMIVMARFLNLPDFEIFSIMRFHFEEYCERFPENLPSLRTARIYLDPLLNHYSDEVIARWRDEALESFRNARTASDQFNIIFDRAMPGLAVQHLNRIETSIINSAAPDSTGSEVEPESTDELSDAAPESKESENAEKPKFRQKVKAKNKQVNEATSNDEDLSNNESSTGEELKSSESVKSSSSVSESIKPKPKSRKKSKKLKSKESFIFNSTSSYISLSAAIFSLCVFNPVFFAMALPTMILVSFAAAFMTYGFSELFLSSPSRVHHDASENKTLERNSRTSLDKNLFAHDKKLTHGFEYHTGKKGKNKTVHLVANQSNAVEKRTKVSA